MRVFNILSHCGTGYNVHLIPADNMRRAIAQVNLEYPGDTIIKTDDVTHDFVMDPDTVFHALRVAGFDHEKAAVISKLAAKIGR